MLEIQASREKPIVMPPVIRSTPAVGKAEASWTQIFLGSFGDSSLPDSNPSTLQPDPQEDNADKLRRDRFLVDDELKRYEEEMVEPAYWTNDLSTLHYWGVSKMTTALNLHR